jgi:hypothetical protein
MVRRIRQHEGQGAFQILTRTTLFRFGARRLRLGQSDRDAGLVEGEDLRAAEGAAIGNGLECLGL